MNNVTVEHYQKKFNDMCLNITSKAILDFCKAEGVSEETLKDWLSANNEDFKKFCFTYARTLMPGQVSCVTYAAVVAVICTMFSVGYTAYAGFCLRQTMPNYDKNLSDYKKACSCGKWNHDFANHVYVEVDGRSYEYYSGDLSNIDHVEVVEIARG